MKNHWTGGQYSLYRFLFGIYLFIHFFQLLPWTPEIFSNQGMLPDSSLSPLIKLFPNILALSDAPAVPICMALFGIGASLFFMIGKWDKPAAALLWYILACFLGRNPLISNPSLPFVGWLLIAHLFIPKAPYGSLAAKDRLDPRGNWQMPPAIFLASWWVMSIAYSYSGLLKLSSPSWIDGTAFAYLLENPLVRCNWVREMLFGSPPFLLKWMTWGALALEIGFVLFALIKQTRLWIWGSMLAMHFGLLMLIDFADLTWGMIFLHFFTFNPSWVKPRQEKLEVYYDGSCGFCHSFIRFILSENIHRVPFRFAPLQERFSTIPDSIVVQENGQLYYKSKAVFKILASLGGLWRILSLLLSLLPIRLSDTVYDLIARIRHRLFAKPKDLCPIIPQDLRIYFE
ncbi:MAG: DUF393 domain-containing protein [Verrucomicrobia bacterium]|nr:DUF393 domain-containing protein [Verrucomicrobiota bacterium]